jgi:GT2 family glycosyltransferase
MNRLGIGVTTYNRPELSALCIQQIEKHTDNYQLFITNDLFDRKGIAWRKNECLKALKDCDYIVLFDEDCFPIKDGWFEYLINASNASGEKHLLYLKETSHIKEIKKENGISYYSNCGGCMMFFTKEVIEKVGGYNKEYGLYGFEHAGYSIRINKSGLTSMRYPSPSNIGEYIYSMDYDNYTDWGVEHKPSLTLKELKESESNVEVFKKDIETIYQEL